MIYSVRRFSDEENKGMGWGTKLAIGAGTLATGFGAAKTGMLGASLQKGANQMWLKGGSMLGSRGMMVSGAKGIQKATVKQETAKAMKDLAPGTKLTDAQVKTINQSGVQARTQALNDNGYQDLVKKAQEAKEKAKAAQTPTT